MDTQEECHDKCKSLVNNCIHYTEVVLNYILLMNVALGLSHILIWTHILVFFS